MELKEIMIDGAISAIGSELMSLAVYRMSGGREEDRQRVLNSMADVLAQNTILQTEIGISPDEFKDAYAKKMDEIISMMTRGEKDADKI